MWVGVWKGGGAGVGSWGVTFVSWGSCSTCTKFFLISSSVFSAILSAFPLLS